LFIGEKWIIFKIIFNFLKKSLKYPEKNADGAFFSGFSENGSSLLLPNPMGIFWGLGAEMAQVGYEKCR